MKIIGLFLLGLVMVAPALGSGSAPAQRQSVKVIQTEDPVYPAAMLNLGVTSGYASILFSVSAEGRLEDSFVTEYSDREFALASLAALQKWDFEPARVAGDAIKVVTELRFLYEAGKVVVQSSGTYGMEVVFYGMHKTHGYALSKLPELDSIPVPRTAKAPSYHESMLPEGETGEALVEFIIDENGRVRLPSVVQASHDLCGVLANEAVKEWQFEAPQRKGRPVAVRVQQLFKFLPKAPTPPASKG